MHPLRPPGEKDTKDSMIPTTCFCDEDQGAGYTFSDEHGDCDVCRGYSCGHCKEMCEWCGGHYEGLLDWCNCTYARSIMAKWAEGDFSAVLCKCCKEEIIQGLATFVTEREWSFPTHWMLK